MSYARTLTLLGSDSLFVGVSLLLFLWPGAGLFFYPLYGAVFIWSDLRGESETPLIFVVLATFAGLFLASRLPPAQALPLVLEIAGLWALSWGFSALRGSESAAQRAAAKEIKDIEAATLDREREKSYYLAYHKDAAAQVRVRREMTESAKSIGSALDAAEVRARLVSILTSRFPGCRIGVQDSPQGDPLLSASAAKGGPVLVKDARQTPFFPAGAKPAFGSGMAVPLSVMRQIIGFVKLEADAPGSFGPEELKTVDVLATVAALSLENIRFHEQIHAQAVRDPLTRLYSHKAFQERLSEEILRAGRSQTTAALIMGDIDHFKTYNDRYGHQAGDSLLRSVAAVFADFSRPVDFPARYGGEEFALILPSASIEQARGIAEKIRRRVASESFMFGGTRTSVTISLGVAGFPADATTASQLVRAADQRLYRAKEGGRDRVIS
ncbi:MAG: GGDEF domain-containing protein [Elusimicrobia bacterium]|nr:GGDEF domain-containing protein [Elusimicrobiota bacterium]MDE2313208.1 GGDEF domain-containing protein [Elusimicrobiota bacterium]